VTSADAPFPAGASEADWRHSRSRDANDVNADMREAVDRDGYSRSDFCFPIFQNHSAPI
jgi:hypothetical protein